MDGRVTKFRLDNEFWVVPHIGVRASVAGPTPVLVLVLTFLPSQCLG
jgi:hypothetical protein